MVVSKTSSGLHIDLEAGKSATSSEKKLGIFARMKYKGIIKELTGPAPDQYKVFDRTKGWFARKYPEKAAEIAGRLITGTDSLGVTKAAELAEYLVDKGKVEAASRIVAFIEFATVAGNPLSREASEIISRVRDKIYNHECKPRKGNMVENSYIYSIDGPKFGNSILKDAHIPDLGTNGKDGKKK